MSDVATNSKALMETTKAEVAAIRRRLETLYFKLALAEVKQRVSSAPGR